MPIVAPQYGITPERKRARDQESGTDQRVPRRPAESTPVGNADQNGRPQFWYPKDLPIPEETAHPVTAQPASRSSTRSVTVEVRKRRSIPR
ncbi:hypothetical protein [Acidithiobacillus sp. AMEEHan]|uniref:hypothetical protein n=1 Tax=Acidithiobacillus sp. AMEEHan TaxID=2994951 RepID=UPI0027E40E92|nr:hypothetical protein [Acidithiobacillus sp. AMEEHan]